jgi:hypothetical protein
MNDWRKIASGWTPEGVIAGVANELEVFADSTGKQVKIKSGRAALDGQIFDSDAQETSATFADNTSGNPRIDRLVLRLTYATETIDFAIVQGTPGASPSPPALTRNATVREYSLAKVSLINGYTTIAAGDVTKERVFILPDGNLAADDTNARDTNLLTLEPGMRVYHLDSGWTFERGVSAWDIANVPRVDWDGIFVTSSIPALTPPFIQAGTVIISVGANGSFGFNWPTPFPNGITTAIVVPGETSNSLGFIVPDILACTLSFFAGKAHQPGGSFVASSSNIRVNYLGIGH